jgi:hypothetical protein
MGNVLTQMRARGELKSLAEMRETVRKSTELGEYEPRRPEVWEEAYARFQKLTETRTGAREVCGRGGRATGSRARVFAGGRSPVRTFVARFMWAARPAGEPQRL